MKIVQANLNMKSFRTYSEKSEKQELLRIRTADGQTSEEAGDAARPQDMVSLSRLARDLAKGQDSKTAGQGKKAESVLDVAADKIKEVDKDQFLVKLLLEALFGKKVNVATLSEIMDDLRSGEAPAAAEAPATETAPEQPLWGVEYHSRGSYREAEQTSFSAQGEILTADGRSINFTLDLVMSREYAAEEHFSFRAGNLVDPLVINFNAAAANLTSSTFEFDLDADGGMENVGTLSRGSGFLVLDVNKDGVVNDGSEMFGPSTGDGFAELAAHDEDGNHWIDESDAVFAQLRIWTVDGEGNQTFQSLGDAGVGAISTDGLSTRFDIKDQANELQGQVRQTGVFVKESGEVGTVQQVDLAV